MLNAVICYCAVIQHIVFMGLLEQSIRRPNRGNELSIDNLLESREERRVKQNSRRSHSSGNGRNQLNPGIGGNPLYPALVDIYISTCTLFAFCFPNRGYYFTQQHCDLQTRPVLVLIHNQNQMYLYEIWKITNYENQNTQQTLHITQACELWCSVK